MKILITGSRTGIGHFLAQHFGAAGHDIWGLGRSPQDEFQRECAAKKISFRFSQTDISDWAQVQTVRKEVGLAWPHLDVLICCAGIQGPLGPATTLDPLAWSASVRINLDGTFFTIRAFFDLLQKHANPRAKILCLSGGGSTAPRPNFTPYASAKAGVVRLVETLAKEWIGQAIDIVGIAPGAINTRMTEEVLSAGPTIVGEKEFAQASEQKRKGGASLPRVAEMIELLLSRDGDGISGRLISTPWDPWESLSSRRQELADSDIFTLRRIVPEDRGKSWK